MNWRMNKHSFWEPKITAEMNQLSAHFSVRNTGNWRDNKHALGFLPPRLKKRRYPVVYPFADFQSPHASSNSSSFFKHFPGSKCKVLWRHSFKENFFSPIFFRLVINFSCSSREFACMQKLSLGMGGLGWDGMSLCNWCLPKILMKNTRYFILTESRKPSINLK